MALDFARGDLSFGLPSVDPRAPTNTSSGLSFGLPAASVNSGGGGYSMGVPVSQAPTLTFPGVPSVGGTDVAIRQNTNLTWGSSVPPVQSQGGIMGGLSNFLSTFSLGKSAAPQAQGTSVLDAYTQYAQTRMQAPATPPIVTSQVDGQTGWIGGLKDALGGVLDYIGSSGDSGATVTPVVMEGDEGPNWPLIVFAVLGAGVAYYAATRK